MRTSFCSEGACADIRVFGQEDHRVFSCLHFPAILIVKNEELERLLTTDRCEQTHSLQLLTYAHLRSFKITKAPLRFTRVHPRFAIPKFGLPNLPHSGKMARNCDKRARITLSRVRNFLPLTVDIIELLIQVPSAVTETGNTR